MNKSNARYNYQNKTIVCSKQFLVLAGQFGTPEFHQLMDMRSKQPTFTVVEYSQGGGRGRGNHPASTLPPGMRRMYSLPMPE